jgi:small subunit ribosomal protein S6
MFQIRPGNLSAVKEYAPSAVKLPNVKANRHSICRNTSLHILRNHGVIRSITNWGQFDLPRPTTKHQTQHHTGHYFIVQFDGSVSVQSEVRRTLSLDPRMIRFSVVKLGDKLATPKGIDSIENVGDAIPWKTSNTGTELGFGDSSLSKLGSRMNR